MASTTLFAPQVRAVQPAFEYPGEVKIYFSLSPYNQIDEIGYIFYTLIDPNKASTWGTNSMLTTTTQMGYVSAGNIKAVTENGYGTGEYYFSININNAEYISPLTKNQFYTMQLYFVDAQVSSNDINSVTWVSNNSQYFSLPSQATLIRPIPKVKQLTIDGLTSSSKRIEKDNWEDFLGLFDSYYYISTSEDGAEEKFYQINYSNPGYGYFTTFSPNAANNKYEYAFGISLSLISNSPVEQDLDAIQGDLKVEINDAGSKIVRVKEVLPLGKPRSLYLPEKKVILTEFLYRITLEELKEAEEGEPPLYNDESNDDDVGDGPINQKTTRANLFDFLTASFVFQSYPINRDLSMIRGRLEYEEESNEFIKNFSIYITDKNGDISYQKINIENFLGLSFETECQYSFQDDDKQLNFIYTTQNGFTNSWIFPLDLIPEENYAEFDNSFIFSINSSSSEGAVTINLRKETETSFPKGKIIIKRANEKTAFKYLENVAEFNIDDFTTLNLIWQDYFIEAGICYDYYFIYIDEHKNKYRKILSHIANFEDIFLLDKDLSLSVRLNPIVNGYKYVVQESITNPLGGRYPVIRKNGETYYRQFNISGTIYFNYSQSTSINNVDSHELNMDSFFEDEEYSQISLSFSEIQQYFKNFDKKYNNTEYLTIRKQNQFYNKNMREKFIKFLTNGKIKLFKSSTEGNMLVHLSNISFTPNKQLGREVYDFSATATEYCEFTIENLHKYLFLPSMQQDSILTGEFKEGKKYTVITPYLNPNKILIDVDVNKNSTYTLLV